MSVVQHDVVVPVADKDKKLPGQRVTFGKNNTQTGWVVKINATAIKPDGTTETGLAEVYEEGTLEVFIGPHSAFKEIKPHSGGRRKSRRRTRRRTTK